MKQMKSLFNNNNSSINIFNEEFVKKNKEKVHLEIKGKISELKSQHKFNNNKNIVTIKLIVKENIFEIDMSEIFANCNKMFYNCSSLLSIIDINDWKISTDIDNYLMFYNCISLIFFPNSVNEKIYDINIKSNMDLGILITKYLQNGKEIILKTKIENNKKKINLYGNE